MVLGGVLGAILSWLFGLDPVAAKIVTILSAAPFGFNTLTYSSICKLDSEFAASLVSTGLIAGIIGLPALILLLNSIL